MPLLCKCNARKLLRGKTAVSDKILRCAKVDVLPNVTGRTIDLLPTPRIPHGPHLCLRERPAGKNLCLSGSNFEVFGQSAARDVNGWLYCRATSGPQFGTTA